jgi:hypothetical protein
MGRNEEIQNVPDWRRWFAFVGGGVAWTLHLLSIYLIGEFGCVSGWGDRMYGKISGVAALILIVSVLLAMLAGCAAIIGWRDSRGEARRARTDDEGGHYLSRVGFILSLLFTTIIALETLPVFGYLDGC